MNRGVHEFCNLFAILAHKSHKFLIKIHIINNNNMRCVHKKKHHKPRISYFYHKNWKAYIPVEIVKNEKKILYIELYFLSTNTLVQLYMPPPVDPARMRAMYKSTTLSPNNINSQKTCKRQSNDKRLTFMSFSALPLSRQCTDILMGQPDRYAIKKY